MAAEGTKRVADVARVVQIDAELAFGHDNGRGFGPLACREAFANRRRGAYDGGQRPPGAP